jgi:hypothetical protein
VYAVGDHADACLTGWSGEAVPVDEMSLEQARQLLTQGLPQMAPTVEGGLLAVTGRWPLLLWLVNKILKNVAKTELDVSRTGAELCGRLPTRCHHDQTRRRQLRSSLMQLILGGGQALGEQLLDGVGAAVHQQVQLAALPEGEVAQHEVGRIHPARRAADTEAHPQVVPAAQGR